MCLQRWIQGHPLVTYFALAFGLSWAGVAALTVSTGLPAQAADAERLMPWVFVAMLAGPSAGALLATALAEGQMGWSGLWARQRRWTVPRRIWAALLLVPGLLAAILAGLSAYSATYVPGILASPAPGRVAVSALVFGVGAGIFEELGWTGFATPRLIARFGPTVGGIALGLLHALWHFLPDAWGSGAAYGALYVPHFLFWIAALTAYRVLMTWVYERTQSLWLGQAMHASFTGSQSLLWPAETSPAQFLVWYGLFAAALWVVVGITSLRRRMPPASHARPE